MAQSLDEQTTSVLTARTEGWPAGLRLVALSVRQRPSENVIAANTLGDIGNCCGAI